MLEAFCAVGFGHHPDHTDAMVWAKAEAGWIPVRDGNTREFPNGAVSGVMGTGKVTPVITVTPRPAIIR
jgi:acyl dehydratase